MYDTYTKHELLFPVAFNGHFFVYTYVLLDFQIREKVLAAFGCRFECCKPWKGLCGQEYGSRKIIVFGFGNTRTLEKIPKTNKQTKNYLLRLQDMV